MAEHVNTFMDWFLSFRFSRVDSHTSEQSHQINSVSTVCSEELAALSVSVEGFIVASPVHFLYWCGPQDTGINGLFVSSRWVTAGTGLLLSICRSAPSSSVVFCVACQQVSMFCSRNCSPESKLYIQCCRQKYLQHIKLFQSHHRRLLLHALFELAVFVLFQQSLPVEIEKGHLKS